MRHGLTTPRQVLVPRPGTAPGPKKVRSAALAAGLAALLALAACTSPQAGTDQPPSSTQVACPKTLNADASKVNQAISTVNDQAGYEALSFEGYLDDPVLTLGAEGAEGAAGTVEPAEVVKALGDTLQCTALVADIHQLNLLEILPQLGLASTKVRLRLDQAALRNQPLVLTPLARTSNLVDLQFRGDLLPAAFPRLETVTSLQMGSDNLTEPKFDAIAERFPNLETLTVLIERDSDFDPEAFASLTNLRSLNFTLFQVLSNPNLEGVSKETLDWIVQAAKALPDLEQLNGLPVGQASQAALAHGTVLTRAERRAEEVAVAATAELEAWGESITTGEWETAGNVNQVSGPALVYDHKGKSSAAAGARGQEWNGIPAEKLCQTKEACKSVVVLGHRSGAKDGYYESSSEPNEKVDAFKGETIVTVYDVDSQCQRPPAVVATTNPPQTILVDASTTGEPDWDSAWQFVIARVS